MVEEGSLVECWKLLDREGRGWVDAEMLAGVTATALGVEAAAVGRMFTGGAATTASESSGRVSLETFMDTLNSAAAHTHRPIKVQKHIPNWKESLSQLGLNLTDEEVAKVLKDADNEADDESSGSEEEDEEDGSEMESAESDDSDTTAPATPAPMTRDSGITASSTSIPKLGKE